MAVENNHIEEIYTLAELRYLETFPNLDKTNPFPKEWYSIDQKQRIMIISEAISALVTVEKTQGYNNFKSQDVVDPGNIIK